MTRRINVLLSKAKTRPMPLSILNDQERWKHMSGRIKKLPKQLKAAREWVAQLEQEARDLGMDDLL
jgi:hypothetical protein